ncbi:MAG: DUF1592 domain-containing protein [Akkermansiaceae bacterium]
MIASLAYRLSRNTMHAMMTAALPCLLSTFAVAAEPPQGVFPEKHREVLEKHCFACHNAEKQRGKFRLDDLPLSISDNRSAERWQKVLNALNSGDMPPEDETPLPATAKADLLDDLAKTIVVARRNLSDSRGVVTMRRLNRREYGNTLDALFGMKTEVNELPADTSEKNFDTVGSSLFMSGDQIDQYLDLGRTAVAEVFQRHDQAAAVFKKRFEGEDSISPVAGSLRKRIEQRRNYMLWKQEVDQAAAKPENHAIVEAIRQELKNEPLAIYHRWDKIPGAPSPTQFGFFDATYAIHVGVMEWTLVPYQAWFLSMPENRTGTWLTVGDGAVKPYFFFNTSDFPSGDYVVRLRVAASEKVDARRRFIEFGQGHGNPFNHDRRHMVTGTLAQPQVIEIPVKIHHGPVTFFVRERGTHDADFNPKQRFGIGMVETGVGPDFAIWLDYVELEKLPTKLDAPGTQAIAPVIGDAKSKFEPAELRKALEAFSIEAFRGKQPSPAFLDRLIAIYDDLRQHGTDHRVALKEALVLVLASPRFLYLAEPQPTAADPPEESTAGKLPATDIATRLSYFLWGAPPDRELRELAASGSLWEPAVLKQQTDRLLNDPRSVGFIKPFLHQWLHMDRLDFFRFNSTLFPFFDASTKEAARSEVFETFAHLLRENRSVSELLKSDYVVVDGLLAVYYGLQDVTGDAFRPVKLPAGSPRGGLLGMAAIHAMGSNGEQTSPVERGAWVLRKLLNDPSPPAPANVPQLTRLEDKLINARERLLMHQEQPQCASCHRRIDPIGFGLENFDTAGQWRTEETYERAGLGKKTWQIDPAGAFHNGPAFASYEELRDLIAAQTDDFARGLSTALVEYGLGRSAGFSDEPLTDRMVSESKKQGFAIRELIHTLVQSREFQSK